MNAILPASTVCAHSRARIIKCDSKYRRHLPPLVVYPFEEERFVDVDITASPITWEPDLELHAHGGKGGGGLCASCAHTLGTRGFVCVYLYLVAAGLAGALPRCAALLIARTANSALMTRETLDEFPRLWSTCVEPGQAYSGYSKNGQLYQMIVGFDHGLNLCGCSLYGVFTP